MMLPLPLAAGHWSPGSWLFLSHVYLRYAVSASSFHCPFLCIMPPHAVT
jgi:hypothetical protein